MKKIALTIAGSDTSCGAGLQADIKTFAAMKVYGVCVAAALTAQNSMEVRGVLPVAPEFIRAQMESLFDDYQISAAKTGMLLTAEAVETVSSVFAEKGFHKIVVDPVIISSSGSTLLMEDGVTAMKNKLLPMAFLVTPNIPEAEALTGNKINTQRGMEEAAAAIAKLGPENVLIKGGHAEGGKVSDILYSGGKISVFKKDRVGTIHSHGTGCALSAAITAGLAKGEPLESAILNAEAFIELALKTAFGLGKGPGSVNHFFENP